MLETGKFSLSHNVFYPIWYLFSILNAFQNVVCNLDQSKILLSGNVLSRPMVHISDDSTCNDGNNVVYFYPGHNFCLVDPLPRYDNFGCPRGQSLRKDKFNALSNI